MATHVRGTLLGSSVIALKTAGHFEDYKRALPLEWHDKILFAPAASWLPIELGEQHYQACTQLGLSTSEILSMGNAVATLTQKSVFSVTARIARESGATPLTLLPMTPKLWSRLFQGGFLRAYQSGPKDSRLEVTGCPLLQYPYFKTALRGLMQALADPFARKVLTREGRAPTDRNSHALLFSWV